MEVFGLLMSSVSNKHEAILLLAPTGGKNEYRRLGVVTHWHKIMDVPTCGTHDHRIGHEEYFYPINFEWDNRYSIYHPPNCRKLCNATHMLHYLDSCFEHAAECEVDVV